RCLSCRAPRYGVAPGLVIEVPAHGLADAGGEGFPRRQPSSRLILVASMAYRRSWPSRSFTKLTRSAYLPFLRGSASSRRSQMVLTTSLLNFSLFPPML